MYFYQKNIIMANIRELKKDINLITEEVISDCLLFVDIHPKHDKQPVADIINKMIDKRNKLIYQVNHHDTKASRSENNTKYKKITEELLDTANSCLEELSKLAKK